MNRKARGKDRAGSSGKDGWRPRTPEELQVGRYVDVLSDSGFKAVFGDEANKE